MKRVAILGSTGSVGVNVLQVIRDLKDQFKVVGLTTNTNINLLHKQIEEFNPRVVAVQDGKSASQFKTITPKKMNFFSGLEGIVKVAVNRGVDLVAICMAGGMSLIPLIESIKQRKKIALASKEAIVMAGEMVNRLCCKYGARIIPIDSEHSAIFQCLNGKDIRDVKRTILTSSGGPFHLLKKERLEEMGPRQALKHPRWRMGKKISIDSATLMNKGLEIIEAHWLFNIPVEKIEVLIHPEAIIHSMVEFVDGNILGLLGQTDMRLPIQYALTYPRRYNSSLPSLDFASVRQLTFAQPDSLKFPCLELAYEVAKRGKSFPCVLNAADEVCVEAFLKEKIKLTSIAGIIARVLKLHKPVELKNIEQVFSVDRWARNEVSKIIGA
jgi:1-deoxy-D-xylulose-5-phosphate reductoisomerase